MQTFNITAFCLAVPLWFFPGFSRLAAAAPSLGAGASSLGAAEALIGAALVGEAGEGAFGLARGLSDGVGQRLSGSPGYHDAVRWAVAEMKKAGLDNVHTEKVMVPRWVRGDIGRETGQVLSPVNQRLALTALGGSIGTPKDGLTAEVIEATSFEELKQLGPRVSGKIVLWNVPMRRGGSESMSNYGDVAKYRGIGAVEAARLGAKGSLVRSLGVADYRLPHTGAMRYDDKVAQIPAAAVSAEDADLLHRLLLKKGPVRLRFQLPCFTQPDVEAANVVGEVRGGARPEEFVLLGAHLDSWDLGTGAVDDAAGVAVVLCAARAMKRAGVVPRRTVRVVLFANEENGLRGGKGYADAHRDELSRHVAAIEVDSGAGKPYGFAVAPQDSGGGPSPNNDGGPAVRLLAPLIAPLAGIGVTQVRTSEHVSGADLSPFDDRVPTFRLLQDETHYFEWHHTAADTLDKIDPLDLNLCAAAVAVAAAGLADSPNTLPRPLPKALSGH